MKQTSHTVQGVNIHINCDQRLYPGISNYLNFFYAGEPRPHIKPLTYDLSIRSDPPAVPINAVKTLKAADITCYRNDADSYYTLRNGSIIHFNPIIRRAEAFIKKKLDGNSRILPLSQIEVYRRLLKQTVLAINKEVSRNQLQAYGKLVRQVRGFELLNGRDIYEQPEAFVTLLQRIGCYNADHHSSVDREDQVNEK